jgi:hypothetical protein
MLEWQLRFGYPELDERFALLVPTVLSVKQFVLLHEPVDRAAAAFLKLMITFRFWRSQRVTLI